MRGSAPDQAAARDPLGVLPCLVRRQHEVAAAGGSVCHPVACDPFAHGQDWQQLIGQSYGKRRSFQNIADLLKPGTLDPFAGGGGSVRAVDVAAPHPFVTGWFTPGPQCQSIGQPRGTTAVSHRGGGVPGVDRDEVPGGVEKQARPVPAQVP